MNKKDPHKKTHSLASFFSYSKGKMKAIDQHAFERHLLNDPFEADALEGFKYIKEDELQRDMNLLSQQIKKQTRTPQRVIYSKSIAIAASLILIAGLVSVLILLQPESPVMVSEKLSPKTSKQATETNQEKSDIQTSPKTEYRSNSRISKEETDNSKINAVKPALKATPKPVNTEKNTPEPEKTQAPSSVGTKKANFSKVTIEPQSTIEPNRKRNKPDSVRNHIYGTLKGEPVIGGIGNLELSTIKGVVHDRYQQPVPGANISLKGTNHATLAKADGSYQLQFPSRDSSQPVMASFAGYVPAEVMQNHKDSINFTLDEDIVSLSEVITIKTNQEEIRKIEEFIPAEPEIGMEAYMDELLKHMIYPPKGSGKKETVVAMVIISPLGHIKDIIIKRSPDEIYSLEAIRLIKGGPFWKPALKHGLPIQDEVKIKLHFIPDQSNNKD